MSTFLKDRLQNIESGNGFLRLAALVCLTVSLGLAVESQTYEHPPEALKLLSSFAMACFIALWLLSNKKLGSDTTPSQDHQSA